MTRDFLPVDVQIVDGLCSILKTIPRTTEFIAISRLDVQTIAAFSNMVGCKGIK